MDKEHKNVLGELRNKIVQLNQKTDKTNTSLEDLIE